MFGQVQRQLLTDRVSCHSPKWVSCDGIDLAEGVPGIGGTEAPPPPSSDHVPGRSSSDHIVNDAKIQT